MVIHARVQLPAPGPLDPVPTGWWVKAIVVLEREPRSALPNRLGDDELRRLEVSQETLSPEWHWAWNPSLPVHRHRFLIDSGSEFTTLGTYAIRDLHLTIDNTLEFEGAAGVDGREIPARGVNGELWILHEKPLIGGPAYSAFRVTYVMAESDLRAGSREEDSGAMGDSVSLIGQDILDYLLTYGGMSRKKPSPGRATPIVFDIDPNWKQYGRLLREKRDRFPHDASSLAARKRTLNQILRRAS